MKNENMYDVAIFILESDKYMKIAGGKVNDET